MCVMFILTRLHSHLYIFEYPFLFGLLYCLEPSREQLEALAGASNPPAAASSQQTKRKSKPLSSQAAPAKPKLSAASLTVRRGRLGPNFFSTDSEFPHHRQLGHLMSVVCGYLTAYAFEDALGCFYPHLLANSRSSYVALLAVAFAVVESSRISAGMVPAKVMAVVAGLAWIVSASLILGGDYAGFVRFDYAFDALKVAMVEMLAKRLGFENADAERYARGCALVARLLVALVASLLSMCVAAPARYFSKLDFGLYCDYQEDVQDHRDDPYYLGKPTPSTMLKVIIDYVGPASVVFLWCVSPRPDGGFGSWRVMALMACCFWKFATLRIRLQCYLDGAVDAYRGFWAERMATSDAEAGRKTSVQVISNSYYLILITMAYVAPTLIPLLLLFVAKLDGGVSIGLCPVKSDLEISPMSVFAQEVVSFLAWWGTASYVLFASASVSYEFVAKTLDPGARERGMRAPPMSSSSERRRQKRMMRQGCA
eukprot:GFKZ01006494.1.p1 GENE.GFKZ01006494.1~~GFKZ01006494.1.p1  ORF type:complete len:551 (-),score=52.81 GFKZ01006494.1:3118-4566(-)